MELTNWVKTIYISYIWLVRYYNCKSLLLLFYVVIYVFCINMCVSPDPWQIDILNHINWPNKKKNFKHPLQTNIEVSK